MSAFELDLGYQYKSIKNRSNSLSQVEAKAANAGNNYSDFGADLFNGLYQKEPELKGGEANLYTETLQAVQNSESFKKIKRQTQGNLNWSAIGASILLDELTQKVDYSDEPPPPSEPPKGKGEQPPKDEEEKDEDKGDDEGDPTEPDKDGDKDDPNGEPSDSDDNDEGEDNEDEDGNGGDDEEDLEDEGNEGEGEDELDEPESEPIPVSTRIQDAVNKAGEKLGEMLAGLKEGTGVGLSNSDLPMIDGFTKLAENPNLVQILRRIGRLKLNNSFLSALQVGGPEETYGVTWNNKLEHLMPQEYAGLAGTEDEFLIFADKYNREALQAKQFISNAKPGKGPMIVCIDISSSMTGDPLQWAKTIAAAMYLLAVKEKRGYAAIFFNSRAYPLEPKDQKRLDAQFLERIVGIRASGGTVYENAWTEATNFMSKVKRGPWSHADIVFITDGECGFNKDQWLKDKAKFGVRLFSFLLGVNQPPPVPKEAEVWTPQYMRDHYSYMSDWTDARLNNDYASMMGTPVNGYYGNSYANLIETSDAVVYVPKFDDESVAQSFELVKNAAQNKGQMVRA